MFTPIQQATVSRFIEEYIVLRERNDQDGLKEWRERVKETFPYQKNIMLIAIRDLVERRVS